MIIDLKDGNAMIKSTHSLPIKSTHSLPIKSTHSLPT